MKRPLIALFVPLLILQIAAYGQSDGSRLNVKQLAKTETVIDQLEQLHGQVANPDLPQHTARVGNLLSSLEAAARSLPEGNIKTDLATAAYWYEQATLNLNHSVVSQPVEGRCAGEKPGAYRDLCARMTGSRRELLLAKARLHLGWAKAFIAFQKATCPDPDRLDEIAFERKNDQVFAARAIELLKVLESEVITYDSLGDFQDSGKLARVPFEVFQRDLEMVSADVAVVLSWLPQTRLKSEINNALLSYQDGGFWWKKTYAPRVVNVSHFSPATSRTAADTNYLSTVPYTIAINWRHGSRYIKRAEKLLEQYNLQRQMTMR